MVVTTPQEVALADVRKELNFCKKTETKIIGVVENMSGFVCPNCACQSEIFPPVTGGAAKMCEDLKIPLLGRVPLEPKLLLSCEAGKCFVAQHPDTVSARAFQEIVTKIKAATK